MARICQITGKKAMVGNRISHSNKKTKRRFNANLFRKKFYWVEEDCWISLNVSARRFASYQQNRAGCRS